MPSPRSSPGTLRERSFLALGLGAALLLVLAALVGSGDPQSAGRAELVSTAARIAEAVKVEWKEWPKRLTPADRSTLVQRLLQWKEGDLPFVEGHELVPQPGSGEEIFDALFAKAEQVELSQSDPKGALEIVLEALPKTKDPARRAEARLRAIQLAAQFDPTHIVQEQYELACSELDGTERKGNVSYRALLALAAAKTLEAESKESELAGGLQGLLDAGTFAWVIPTSRFVPPTEAHGEWTYEDDPATAAMLALLEPVVYPPYSIKGPGMHPTGHPPWDWAQRRVAQALRAEFGSVPQSGITSLTLIRARSGFLLHWMRSKENSAIGRLTTEATPDAIHHAQEGGFASDTTIREAFLKYARLDEVVPAAFVVDVDPPASKATAVREHDLLDGDFGFTVKHEDPEAWIRRSAAKQKLLRGALLVLALLSAAAGVATFRALRRERTLAALKTDFVANVSHELRTPLASILLLSENLEAGRVTSEADKARYHSLIRREALRLRRLVDDVLDFSRLERGKRIDIRREALRVDPWLERTGEELAEWAREHSLELAIVRSPTDAEAEVDAEALRRALLNLLDNARKHSGGANVELGTAREGRELVLRVRDHGRGVSAEDRERIFEPFMRLANGDAPGAGLGLSIVREIAREHGGSVRALDPDDGPGIVFEMRIPLAEETAA